MYNLLVSAHPDSWNGDHYFFELDRCLREYTDKSITEKYGNFSQSIINEISRFPSIFAYESFNKKDPKFGLIRDVISRQGKAKISFEIIPLERFLTYSELNEMLFDLDISNLEMNRTHWAVKDIDLAKTLMARGIALPEWIRRDSKSVDVTKHHFDVALSFPGEIRERIEPIVAELEREIGPDAYFYDYNYKAQLARPSLDLLLQDIYGKRSKLIVVFLCQKYQEKEWCGIEFRAIKEILMERKNEKIMFIKMDDGKVEGVFKTDGYVDGRKNSPKEIARFIKERIGLLP